MDWVNETMQILRPCFCWGLTYRVVARDGPRQGRARSNGIGNYAPGGKQQASVCVRIHCAWVARGQRCPVAPSPARGNLRRPVRSATVVEGLGRFRTPSILVVDTIPSHPIRTSTALSKHQDPV